MWLRTILTAIKCHLETWELSVSLQRFFTNFYCSFRVLFNQCSFIVIKSCSTSLLIIFLFHNNRNLTKFLIFFKFSSMFFVHGKTFSLFPTCLFTDRLSLEEWSAGVASATGFGEAVFCFLFLFEIRMIFEASWRVETRQNNTASRSRLRARREIEVNLIRNKTWIFRRSFFAGGGKRSQIIYK